MIDRDTQIEREKNLQNANLKIDFRTRNPYSHHWFI